jgi:hypothetical protein
MFFHYNVYVACSLTHASPEFRGTVEDFKKNLRAICNVMCFLGIGNKASPHEIYKWDIHECVRKSDLVVAICDLPSTGLGYELGTQVEARGMPCLMIAHVDSLVTELILDMRKPGSEFKRYNDLHVDGIALVAEKLQQMHIAKIATQPHLFPHLVSSDADAGDETNQSMVVRKYGT